LQAPIKFRPEPKTDDEIRAEIAFLEDQLNGHLDPAIQDRINILKRRLNERR
jgi:hypothetical protein